MLFLPDHCPLCSKIGRAPCEPCAEQLPVSPRLTTPNDIDRLTTLFAYEGRGRDLIRALKFRNRRGCVRWMASELAAQIHSVFDAVTWMPSSYQGRYERGFDPAKLLARAVGHELNVPAYRLLVRTGDERQSHRSAVERHLGPKLKLTAKAYSISKVLLIDDVCTTGASISSAARLLRSVGVSTVEAAVVAQTPSFSKVS